jgi:glycosyltransferase involved in cell wall biosynthesis
MKVLLINTTFRSAGGGAERNARELYERLPARGIEPTMFVARRLDDDPPGVVGVRLAGEKYLRALEWVLPAQDWRMLGSRLALGRLPAGAFDVVHLHNLHGGWLSINAVARLARRFPTVWTMHDAWGVTGGLPHDLARVLSYEECRARWPAPPFPLHSSDPVARATMARLGPRLPRPSAIICPSQYMADLAGAAPQFRGVPVRRIPLGMTMLDNRAADASREEARAAFGIAPSAKVLLIVAASLDSPFKGIPFALELLRRLRPGEAEVLALGTGGGDLLRDLPVRVTCTGRVADESRLALAYRAADVTLIPSVADNFPYVALESFTCRRPLATFRVGGLTELVGDSERGLSADPFDVEQLLGHVRLLLGDSALANRLGRNGRHWVEQNCGVDHTIGQVADAYREATERFRAGAGVGTAGAAMAPVTP